MAVNPLILTSILAFLTFFYLFANIAGQRKLSRLKNSFLFFSGLYLIIILAEILLRLPFSEPIHKVVIHVSFPMYMLTGIAYLDFAHSMLHLQRGRIFRICLILAFIGLLSTFFPNATVFIKENDMLLVVPSRITSFTTIFSIILPASYALYATIKMKNSLTNERERRIVSLFQMGTLISLIIGSIISVIIPLFIPKFINVYYLSSLSPLIIVSFLYYAMRKYHFLIVNYDEIEEVSQTLFNNIHEGVILFGRENEVIQANGEAQKLLGSHISLQSIKKHITGFDLATNDDMRQYEVTVGQKRIPVAISLSDITNEELYIGKLLLIRDISEQVKMEERIRQSEKLESLGQLAGGVAHDFNNQLTGIIGCADYLQQELPSDSPNLQYIDMILTSAERSADLTQNLLAFARKGKYSKTLVDINKVIYEVEALLGRTIDKRIKMTLNCSPKNPAINGDPTQIQNALLNLCINSSDAMADTGGELIITTEVTKLKIPSNEDLPALKNIDTFVEITVKDSGCGIDNETQKHIFEPFYTTKEQGKGTGMGLAAVYGTVINHNGYISVSSEPGSGTTFSILLPLSAESVEHVEEESQKGGTLEGNETILIIDDEPLILSIGKQLLEHAGYTVKTVDNGTSGITLVEENPSKYQLVILDIIMPGLRGDQVFHKLQEITPKLPILLSSGYSEEGIAHELLTTYGAAGFIQKPFRSKELLTIIKEILENTK